VASVTVRGLAPLMNAFTAAGRDAPRLAARALYEEAQEAFILSQNMVPVDMGVLKSSGQVHFPVVSGTKAMVMITYGGAASAYAVYVHEIPPNSGGRWGKGAKHASPTRYKYLEYPVKRYSRGMASRMTTRVLDMINRRFA
jgi:hypothetical protein